MGIGRSGRVGEGHWRAAGDGSVVEADALKLFMAGLEVEFLGPGGDLFSITIDDELANAAFQVGFGGPGQGDAVGGSCYGGEDWRFAGRRVIGGDASGNVFSECGSGGFVGQPGIINGPAKIGAPAERGLVLPVSGATGSEIDRF